LNNLCIENKVTILFLPTVLAEKFVGLKNDYLKILYFGGEKFCKNVKTTYKLCNSYGLTETGILNTFYEVKGNEEDIPLGAPIYNTDIVIIDEEEKIVDIGVVGEIVVLGESLAIGYKNDLRKTQDKFICLQGMENSRGYKTGDIGYIGTD
ncbi:AMP-binding protein, partial [Streptococcus agalactiae]